MGMFDTVYCEFPLPDPGHQGLEFQTKDLESLLDRYTITADGRLMRHARRARQGPDRDVEWPIHGDVSFYTSEDGVWIEYVARFTHGRVEWILPREEAPPAPPSEPGDWEPLPEVFESLKRLAESRRAALPAEPPAGVGDAAAAPGTEEALLAALRRDRPELEKLLAKSSDHWGYEDAVYRFYHQSFKVYGLQRQTESIVSRLQALAPDLPLNPWFVQIVESGTGKEWKPEDNARWTEVTRPILEAFFHARFFLEMAVRHADLQAPPQPLPSGYAALLYLFGIR